jgi:hypothetical protein
MTIFAARAVGGSVTHAKEEAEMQALCGFRALRWATEQAEVVTCRRCLRQPALISSAAAPKVVEWPAGLKWRGGPANSPPMVEGRVVFLRARANDSAIAAYTAAISPSACRPKIQAMNPVRKWNIRRQVRLARASFNRLPAWVQRMLK